MQKSTIEKLKKLAPDLLLGKLPYPIPATVQQAISILKILEDGKWHTAAEIAEELGIGKKYVRDILRTCKEPWALEMSNPQGWKLNKRGVTNASNC